MTKLNFGKKGLSLFLFVFILGANFFGQTLINANVRIDGFRHNYDCGSDAGGINSQPDPRYKVWLGYNSGNFTQINVNQGLFPGCSNTYGADAVNCSFWNPGIINAITFQALPMTSINVDLESWEEDGCGSNCDGTSCTFNSDDVRCGRTRIGDINFWNNAPCASSTYTGQYTSGSFLSMFGRCSDNNGGGYGIDKLYIDWSFASSPTITSEPFPYDRTLCPGQPTTLTVAVNSWNGWSLGRLVQWQVSSSTDCATPGTWTNISGATSLSYTPPQTPGTRLYRCVISSHCTDINLQQVVSQCVRVTYHPYAAPIISMACNTTTVPNVPIQFCSTLPPDAGAIVNAAGYTWTVTPSSGVTISTPTQPCTDITFANSGSYTISITYNDACPDANATATCNTVVSPPACDLIYVDATAGNNANLGFDNAPVANLWRAMQLVGGGRTNIRITGGTYTEPNVITLQNNVVIDGSWKNTGGVWTKESNQTTTLNFSGEETLSASVTHKVGIKANGISGWRLQDLVINTNNASGTATDGRGKSNYGVLIANCSNYYITRCAINVGTATNGSNGNNGANGTAGSQGATGLLGHCDNNTTNRIGGVGATANGTGTRQGGAGGNGGNGSDHNSSNNTAGSNGSAGGGGAAAGAGFGAAGANGGGGTDTNRDGRKGGDGANGTNGANASVVADVTNTTFGAFWTPNGAAASGVDGGGGAGGQGGGGGGRQSCFFCDDGGGSGGGGGGSGGQGGAAGTGGMGGGGSFGIYRFNSNTGASIQDITITAPGIIPSGGAGGVGGTGAAGGAGGCGAGGNNTSTTSGGSLGSNGGLCSTGRVCGNSEVGAGGQGGRGGNGGNGGNGQPGANGYIAYMVTDGTFTNPSTSIPNPTTISLFFPNNGKACNNSEVLLTNTSPSTWTLTGSTLLNNVGISSSSYTYNSNPIMVYYSNSGLYNVTTNGGTYLNWINIIDNTRPANMAFNIPSTTICSGQSFSIDAPTWGTELEWDWVFYQNNINSPIATSTSQTANFTAPTVTSTTTYTIRYRVRESCCGWSKGYYTNITVVPVSTPVVNATNSVICAGESVTLSTSGGGTYLWNTGETTSSISVNTPGNYSVTVVDPNGCTATSATTNVTLNVPVTPTVSSISGNNVICPPASVTLQVSGSAATYLWNTGATTSTITVSQGGVYDVSIVDLNGCDAQSSTFTVYDLTANITTSGPADICQGDVLNLTVSSPYLDPTATFVWYFNGSVIPGETTNSYNATQTGSYYAVVSNATCSQQSISIQVNVYTSTVTSTNNATTLCPGSSLLLTASSGTSYQWYLNGNPISNATSQTYSATQGGTYYVTSSNGTCTSTSDNFVIIEIIPTVNSAGGATTLCPGSTLVLTSSTGVSYQWNLNGTPIAGATNQTYSVTAGGSYTVSVNDGACTSTSNAFVITEIVPTITSAGGATTLCPGSTLVLTSSPGVSYQWNLNGTPIAGATSQTYSVTAAGSYTVTVNDGACTSTSTAFVITEIIPTITSASGGTALCPGSSLLLTASAGVSYQWNLNGNPIAGATNQTYSATQAGTYTVTVNDGACTSTSNAFTITNINPTITSTNNATTLCPGSTLVLTASAGQSYQWNLNGNPIAGATNQTFSVTVAGSYTVTVTDGACTSTSNAFVITEIIPTITSAGGATTLCPGSTLVLTSSTGVSYQWNLNGTPIAGATNQTYSVTAGGSYTVTVNDGACTSTSNAFVITEIIPTITSAGGATTLCPGSTLVLTSSPGVSYQWNLNGTPIAGATSQTFSVTAAGSYTVTVNDGACTSTSTAFVITEIIPTITSASGGTALCPGSSLLLTASAGVSYQWNLNGNPIAGATNQTYSATQAGTYTVTVNDGACTSTSNAFTITNINPTITSTNNATTLCPGSTLVLTASAGQSYQWNLNGNPIAGATNQTYSVTAVGSYTVTVTDGACTSTSNAFVVTEIIPTITSAGGATTLCPGSTLVLTASTGVSYQWNLNGTPIAGATNQTYSVTSGGSYSVTVNTGSCTSTSSIFVITEIVPTITSAGGATTLCPGSSLVLTSSIGTSYQWNLNGTPITGATNQTFTATQAGSYTVSVTTTGCTSTSVAFIITSLAPVITSTNNVTVLCTNGTLTLTSTVATSYQWQLNGVNIFGATNQTYVVSQAGTYTVVTTNNGCTATSANFVVTMFTPVITSTNNAQTICPGSSLTLTAANGTSYQWYLNGAAIAGATNATYSATQAGLYFVQVSNGICTSTSAIFDLTVFTGSISSTGNVTTICPGTTLTLTASNGTSYQWLLNGVAIAGATQASYSATQAGTYSVQISNGNCSITTSNFVITTFTPTVSSAGNSTQICQGSTLVLTASQGTSYQWSLNGTAITGATNATYTVTQAGTYSVSVSNGNCASNSANFVVTLYTPTITGAGGATTFCPGTSLVLTASNGTSYQWNLNGTPIAGATSATFTANQAGNYSVTVNNGNCASTSNVFVLTETPIVTPDITVSSTSGCAPATINVSSNGNFTTVVWSINSAQVSTQNSFDYVFNFAGCYTIQAVGTLPNGCSVTATEVDLVCVTASPNAFFTVYPSNFSQEIENVSFNNGSTNATTYVWNFGNGNTSVESNPNFTFSGNQNGHTVTLIATNAVGCSSSYTVNIPFIESGAIFYVPNAFTPDGDEFNQNFVPVFTSGYDPFSFNMKIFNRWGEVVFESNDATKGWDGTYSRYALKAPEGVYTWKITYKSKETDRRETAVGSVTLLR